MEKLLDTTAIKKYEKVLTQIPEVVEKYRLSPQRISSLSGIPLATLKRRLKQKNFTLEETKHIAQAINNYLQPKTVTADE